MRRTFRPDPKTGELVEVTPDRMRRAFGDSFVRTEMHFKTTDGVEITSRKKRDEYMRRNNLVDFEYQPPRDPRIAERQRTQEIIRAASDAFEKRRDLARARGEKFFGRR